MNPTTREFVPTKARPAPINTAAASSADGSIASGTRTPATTGSFSSASSTWWSPGPVPDATQSALMPEKSPWNRNQIPGLGLNFGVGSPRKASYTVHAPSPLRNAYTRDATPESTPPKTFPMMQHEFGTPRNTANQPRVRPTPMPAPMSEASTMSSANMGSNTESSTATSQTPSEHEHEQTTPTQRDEDTMSCISAISPHYLVTFPELAGKTAGVFEQGNHPQSFKRLSQSNSVDFVEAFQGALNVAAQMNPDYYSMPFGTRVVNIKTDHVANIHYSIRNNVWSTLDKVSQRIMAVWDARMYPSDKVLFLFSINSSKHYCGMAEMSGPYDPDGAVEGWQGASSGTIPVTWRYVKNVPYTSMSHITQIHNNQPVVNMWNGMKITSDTGRKVMEAYCVAPHLNNILAWAPEIERPIYVRPRAQQGSRGLRGSRGGMAVAGESRASVAANNWRGPPQPVRPIHNTQEQDMEEVTPTRSSRGSSEGSSGVPSRFGNMVATPSSNVVNVPCVMNADGTYTVAETYASAHRQATGPMCIERVPSHDFFNSQVARGGHVAAEFTRSRSSFRGGRRGGPQTIRNAHSTGTIHPSDFDKFRRSSLDASRPVFSPIANAHSSQTQFAHPLRHTGGSVETLVCSEHQNVSQSVSRATIVRAPQPRQNGIPLQRVPTDPFGAQNGMGHGRAASKVSDGSYPDAMRDADSMAGYAPANRMTQLKHDGDKTPTKMSFARDAVSNFELLPQKIEDWKRKTPTEPAFNNHALQRASSDKSSRINIYAQAADNYSGSTNGALVRSQSSQMSLRKKAEYFRLQAEKAEAELRHQEQLDAMKQRLAILEIEAEEEYAHAHAVAFPRIPGADSDDMSLTRTRGSSEADDVSLTSSAVEHIISPLMNRAGHVVPSISRHNSPPNARRTFTDAGRRSLNAPYDDSWDSSVKANVDYLLSSPPSSSIGNNAHSSPPASSSSVSEADTYSNSNPSEGGGVALKH